MVSQFLLAFKMQVFLITNCFFVQDSIKKLSEKLYKYNNEDIETFNWTIRKVTFINDTLYGTTLTNWDTLFNSIYFENEKRNY